MELIIVTGISGAGKSRAVNALEDIGFFCVDNIPPRLISKFAELCYETSDSVKRVAIVVDVRSKEMFGDLTESLQELDQRQQAFQVLFLEAEDAVVVRRYKETRRRHPLIEGEVETVEEALGIEREMLAEIRQRADYVIDTSLLSNAQLRERIAGLFLEETDDSMHINCLSFGFKYGLPSEADFVLDVRCLPNPFYIEELRDQTGLDEPVREYVMSFEETQGLIPKLLDMIDYLLPLYAREGKSQLMVAIGCTGGMHRSVALTQLLYDHLHNQGYRVNVSHRDIDRAKH